MQRQAERPGGLRWMPVSPLCCHAVPPVSRQSFHRYSLYMETDTSRCGTLWVYTTRTCVIDAKTLLPGCRVNVAEVCTVQTPTPSWEAVRLKGCFTGESSTSPCAAETTTTTMMMMMIGFSRPPQRRADRGINVDGCWKSHVGVNVMKNTCYS